MDGLVKKGYMLREIDKDDRRNMIITLSKRGKNLTTRLNKAFIEIHKEILEEIDVWFSSRKEENEPGEPRKDTGLYMVHYVEDSTDLEDLRELLMQRGGDSGD